MGNFFNLPVEPPREGAAFTPLDRNELLRTNQLPASRVGSIRSFVTAADDWRNVPVEKVEQQAIYGLAERTANPNVLKVLDGRAGVDFRKEVARRVSGAIAANPAAGSIPESVRQLTTIVAIDVGMERAAFKPAEIDSMNMSALEDMVLQHEAEMEQQRFAAQADPETAELQAQANAALAEYRQMSDDKKQKLANWVYHNRRAAKYENTDEQADPSLWNGERAVNNPRMDQLLTTIMGSEWQQGLFNKQMEYLDVLKAREVGILDHDPVQEGTWEKDAGSYSKFLFADQKLMSVIATEKVGKAMTGERVLAEMRKIPYDDININRAQTARDRIREQAYANMIQHMDVASRAESPEGNLITPLDRASGAPTNRMALNAVLGNVAKLAGSMRKELVEAQRDTVWETIGKRVAVAAGVPEEVARDEPDIFNNLGSVLSYTIVNTADLVAGNLDGATKLTKDVRSSPAFDAMTPETKRLVMREFTTASGRYAMASADAHEEYRKATDRLARANEGTADPNYSMADYVRDAGQAILHTVGHGMTQGVLDVVEDPVLVPGVLVAERIVEPAVAGLVQEMRPVFWQNVIKSARFKNTLKEVGRFAPNLVEEWTASARTAAKISVTQGTPLPYARAMDELIARAQTLKDLHIAGQSGRQLDDAVLRWAQQFERVMPYNPDLRTVFGKDFESFVNAERATGGVREVWQAWQGKVPASINKQVAQTLSAINSKFFDSMTQKALGMEVPGNTYLEAVTKYANARVQGDANAMKAAMADIINQGTPSKHGPLHADILRMVDIDRKMVRLRRRGLPQAERKRLAQETKADIHQLFKDQLPSEVDMATLRVLDDVARRPGRAFWDNLQRWIYKATGRKLFSHAAGELWERTHAARRMHDWFNNGVLDYMGAAVGNSMRRLRLDHAYRYTMNKVQNRIDELMLERALHEFNGNELQRTTALADQERLLNQLHTEWRSAISTPTGARWMPENTLLMRNLKASELHGLMKDEPILWENLDPAEFIADPKHNPTTRKMIQDLLRERRRLKRIIREVTGKMGAVRQLGAMLADSDIPLVKHAAKNARNVLEFHENLRKVVTDLGRLVEATDEGVKALAGGRRIAPDTVVKNYKEYMRGAVSVLESQDKIPFESAEMMRRLVDIIPDRYFNNRITLRWLQDHDGDELGFWRSVENVLALANADDPAVFFHEFGHAMLHLTLDGSEVRKLFKIFNDTHQRMNPTDAGKMWKALDEAQKGGPIRLDETMRVIADNAPYLDQFTEWFADQFSFFAERRLSEMVPEARANKSLFERARKNIMDFFGSFFPVVRAQGASAPAERWFKDFFDGRVRTANFDLDDAEILARERWFQFQRELSRGITNAQKSSDPTLRMMVESPMEMDLNAVKRLNKAVNREFKPAWELMNRGPTIDPADFDVDAMRELRDRSMAKHRRTMTELEAAMDQDLLESKLNFRFRNQVRGRKLPRTLAQEVKGVQEVIDAKAATRKLHTGIDPFLAGLLPFWDQVRAIKSIVDVSSAAAAVEATKLDTLASALKQFDPKQKDILRRLIKAGGDHTKMPAAVRRTLDELRTTPHGSVIAQNLTDWAQSESTIQAKLIESLHETGYIDDGLYANLRRAGYSPHLYGMFERPKLVTSKIMQETKRALRGSLSGEGTGPVTGIDGSELMFARDLTQWRVRVREADGFVHDKVFSSDADAKRYMMETFDDEIINRQVDKKGDGRMIYRTLSGDDVVLAEPVGPNAEVLDLLTGKVRPVFNVEGDIVGWREVGGKVSPEARLEAFAKLNRDLHANMMLNNMREFGLVLTPEEALTATATKAGKGGLGGVGPFISEYVQLPDAPHSLGNMAGQYVHKKTLAALNDLTHSHDQLRSWVDSLSDLYNRHGENPLSDLLQKGVIRGMGRGMERVGRAIKHTQILMSLKAWMANITGNIVFGMLASGPSVLDPRNVRNLLMAAADVFGGRAADLASYMPSKKMKTWATKMKGRMGSKYLDEAIENRVINGALFERLDNPNLRRAFVDLAQLEDTKKLQRREARLQQLLEDKQRAMDLGHRTRDIQMEIVAVEQALEHAQRGWTKKFAEWMLGTFGWITNNRLGLPASGLAELARSAYGKVDDFFKLANYINLREQGMPAEAATWHIRQFMQDYANVPAPIRALSHQPWGALVPSFGYEMARIFTNAVRYKPHRVSAILGSVAAVNALGAATAGISQERFMAMQEATGRRTPIEKIIGLTTSLQFYDPYSKSMWMNVDIGDSFLPLFQFADSHSALGRVADSLFDRQDRSTLESAAAVGLKVAGNFVGGQPGINWLGAITTGRDPVTGKKIWDQEAKNNSLWDITRGVHRVFTQSFIPPALPGGRDFGEVYAGLDQPVHPDTGKTMGGRSAGTSLINALTNIKVRGWPAQQLTRLLGADEKGRAVDDRDLVKMIVMQADAETSGNWGTLPIYGLTADQRKLWAKMMAESDPEGREKLRMEIKRTFDKDDKFYVAGQKASRNRTAYEQMLQLKALDERGVENHFNNLNLFNQTMALIAMDAVKVHPTTFQSFRQLAMTSERREQLTAELERDPYMVRQALEKLDDYLREKPSAAEKFELFKQWMTWAQEQAYGVGLREMYKYERTR